MVLIHWYILLGGSQTSYLLAYRSVLIVDTYQKRRISLNMKYFCRQQSEPSNDLELKWWRIFSADLKQESTPIYRLLFLLYYYLFYGVSNT